MSQIIPIFYDTTSLKSILTLSKPSEVTEIGPDSIVKLAKDAGLKEVYLVSNNFHSFMEAAKNLKAENIAFRFGLEVWLCNDVNDKSEESLYTEHKIIIWTLNSQGYEDLVKIYTDIRTSRDNFYYKFRYDEKKLAKFWTNNLMITLPFFDSFLSKNRLAFKAKIVPNFPAKPILMREVDTDHLYERQINFALNEYSQIEKDVQIIDTKTVYYAKESDFKAYTVYRTIHNQSEFSKPNLEMFSSNKFSFETWKNLTSKA